MGSALWWILGSLCGLLVLGAAALLVVATIWDKRHRRRVMEDGSAWEEVAVVDAEPAEAKGPGASDPHDAPPVDQGGGQGTGPKQDKEDADDEAGPKKDQDVAT